MLRRRFNARRAAARRPRRAAVVAGVILICCLSAGPAGVAKEGASHSPAAVVSDAVSVRTAWPVDRVRPGDALILAVVLEIADGYHLNADSGQIRPSAHFKPYPTRVTITEASEGLTVEMPLYPPAHSATVAFTPAPLMVFDGRSIVYVPMRLAGEAGVKRVQVKLTISYQACDDQVCLFPQQVDTTADLPVAVSGESPQAVNRELFTGYRPAAASTDGHSVGFSLFGWNYAIDTATGGGVLLLLLTAALGGLLLNFTPCVLPLVPIKIMSLSMTAHTRSRCLALGLSMFLGILAFWLALGLAIATISGFTAINRLFQFPVFTILVGLIIGLMGLGMWRSFLIQLPDFLYAFNPRQDTLIGSMGLGILTAVLSTPCTAPFMGAAAAWAATRAPTTTLVTFAAIGAGMALPYLLLAAAPNLAQQVPASGPASVLIKQAMGLFMLAGAAYFVGSGVSALMTVPPNPPGKLYWWVVMGFGAAGGLWIALRTVRVTESKLKRFIFVGLGVLIFLASGYGGVRLTDRGAVGWIYFTPQRFQAALDRNQAVVLVFTAEWCLNCKALEQGVLQNSRVVRRLEDDAVAPIKVDITGHNPAGNAKLRALGHLTIPLLVVYAPTGKEVFRSDFYTADQIIAAVNSALGETDAATPNDGR